MVGTKPSQVGQSPPKARASEASSLREGMGGGGAGHPSIWKLPNVFYILKITWATTPTHTLVQMKFYPRSKSFQNTVFPLGETHQ